MWKQGYEKVFYNNCCRGVQNYSSFMNFIAVWGGSRVHICAHSLITTRYDVISIQFDHILSICSTLRLQKRLASAVMKCGKNKVWLDPNETSEIANANSRKLALLLHVSLLTWGEAAQIW